jgi:hypothetical protein
MSELPGRCVSLGGEDVKADLGPIINPLSQLDRFVLLVLGWQQSELRCSASLHRKIAMQFDQQRLRGRRLGGINLNFIIILRTRAGRVQQSAAHNRKEQDAKHHAGGSCNWKPLFHTASAAIRPTVVDRTARIRNLFGRLNSAVAIGTSYLCASYGSPALYTTNLPPTHAAVRFVRFRRPGPSC